MLHSNFYFPKFQQNFTEAFSEMRYLVLFFLPTLQAPPPPHNILYTIQLNFYVPQLYSKEHTSADWTGKHKTVRQTDEEASPRFHSACTGDTNNIPHFNWIYLKYWILHMHLLIKKGVIQMYNFIDATFNEKDEISQW